MSSRRSIMTLFSAPDDPWSHRTRIVLAEKGISIDIVSVEAGRFPEDLLDLNPYHSVPTLVDRDLVLYDSRVIIEYLDERFPHPPLMPVDPVTRAQFRLALYRIERDWYGARPADRPGARQEADGEAEEDPARHHAAEHRAVQDQAVLPLRRVLAGGRDRSRRCCGGCPITRSICRRRRSRSRSTCSWCSRARRSARLSSEREQEMRLLR